MRRLFAQGRSADAAGRKMPRSIAAARSAMMVSEVKYPTFKKINWRTQHPFVKTLIIVLLVGLLVILWKKILPVAAPFLFVGYLVYGFVRPFISRRLQREIEVDDEPDDDESPVPARPVTMP